LSGSVVDVHRISSRTCSVARPSATPVTAAAAPLRSFSLTSPRAISGSLPIGDLSARPNGLCHQSGRIVIRRYRGVKACDLAHKIIAVSHCKFIACPSEMLPMIRSELGYEKKCRGPRATYRVVRGHAFQRMRDQQTKCRHYASATSTVLHRKFLR
jgi:hypothetical protein